ncbi:hypothetical protein ACFQ3Z_45865 [Streptomyces nogalater]
MPINVNWSMGAELPLRAQGRPIISYAQTTSMPPAPTSTRATPLARGRHLTITVRTGTDRATPLARGRRGADRLRAERVRATPLARGRRGRR